MFKRAILSSTPKQLPSALNQIVGLPADALCAHHTTLKSLQSLLDPEEKLLEDLLIDPFNDVAAIFDDLCDVLAGRGVPMDA